MPAKKTAKKDAKSTAKKPRKPRKVAKKKKTIESPSPAKKAVKKKTAEPVIADEKKASKKPDKPDKPPGGKKQTMIIISYPLGRAGSSALTGYIEKCGASLGNPNNINAPTSYNKKGIFENQRMMEFFRQVAPGSYLYPNVKPSISDYNSLVRYHSSAFLNLIEHEFKDAPVIAFKSPNYLAPALTTDSEFNKYYKVRVIQLTRNMQDHAESIRKVWKLWHSKWLVDNILENHVRWHYEFKEEIEKSYPLNYTPVTFEDLLNDTVSTAKNLCHKLSLNYPGDEVTLNWFDRGMANSMSPVSDQ